MWRAVLETLDTAPSPATWQSIPAFAAAHAQLTALLAQVEAAGQGQQERTVGHTLDKEAAEATAIGRLLDLAGAAKAYAIDQHNNDLYAQLDYSRSALERLSDNTLHDRLRAMADAIAPLVPALADAGVTTAEFQEALGALNDYRAALATPRTAIAERKVATDSIPTLLKQGRQVLDKLDGLNRRLRDKAPTLAAAYTKARVIVDAGTRHRPPADQTASRR